MGRNLATAAVLLLGCGEVGYRVVIVPEEGILSGDTVWELAVLRGECPPELDDGGPFSAEALVRQLPWWATGDPAPEIGDLDPGRYAFYARVRDRAECMVRGAGCASIRAEAGGEGQVEVDVHPVDGPGCDDAGECPAEWCAGPDGCSSTVDADGDGVPCPDDCDDDDGDVTETVAEGCNGPDDCQPAELEGIDFVFCSARRSWWDALDTCETLGEQGSLAVPRSWEQHDAVLFYAFGLVETDWWVGANDIEVEGFWTDPWGEEPFFQPWAKGAPNGGTAENCAALSIRDPEYPGDWEDRSCEDLLPAVCW